ERLHGRVPRGAARPRREGAPDLRRHRRDPDLANREESARFVDARPIIYGTQGTNLPCKIPRTFRLRRARVCGTTSPPCALPAPPRLRPPPPTSSPSSPSNSSLPVVTKPRVA